VREWSKQWQYVLLAAAGVLVVAALAANHLGASEPAPIAFEAASRLPPGTPIRVHVTGEVVSPGVYQLAEGDRVIDAVNMAGGFASGADGEALNQARKLRDGEQLVVPPRSVRAAPTTTPQALLQPGGLVNLNTATREELDLLPGIGEAYSRRIVDSRAVDGSFKSVEDLLTRKVVPAATFEKIRSLVTVGP
jgi:competence protein ComEA